MRNLVLALVLLNLGFFAYAAWIDSPRRADGDGAPALPKLLLASEFAQAAQSAEEPARPAPPQEAITPRSAAPTTGVSPESHGSATCLAVGPFNDPSLAAKASSALQDLGLTPRERRTPGEVTDGFWVHVENIATAADQSRVMRELLQAGLVDASPIQSADQTRHISVGIFSDRGRAERRAKSVQRLGIDAQVSPRTHSGTVYWLEMEPKGNQPSLPIEGIAQTEGAPLELRACNAIPVA
jgi:hypothetical protein